MTVRVTHANVDIFKPAFGDPADRYTVSATAPDLPAAPSVVRRGNGLLVDAPSEIASLLVRVPTDVTLDVNSEFGDVNVTDISGNANIHAGSGSVQVMLGGWTQASVRRGSISATMGSTTWPGVLKFSDARGDIIIWLTETAKFHVHMHTDRGILFSDFGLRGTSQGESETIDADVNGGGPRGLDIEVKQGNIRLMRLHPEA